MRGGVVWPQRSAVENRMALNKTALVEHLIDASFLQTRSIYLASNYAALNRDTVLWMLEGLSNGRLTGFPPTNGGPWRPNEESAAQAVISFNQNMRLSGGFDKNFSCNIGGNAAVYCLLASSQRGPMFLTSCIAPIATKQIHRLLSIQKVANVSANASGD